MAGGAQRPNEVTAPVDPALEEGDARVVFIGRARTPWIERHECPHNLRQARERGGAFSVWIDGPWRAGLQDLAAGDAIIVLYWMDRSSRNLIVQSPRHSPTPRGVFSLRSPARPNPVALAAVRIVDLDAAAGRVEVDALDCLDGTPIVDIKPWIESVDIPPPAA